MLLEIFTEVISDIKTEIPGLPICQLYKNELLSDEWKPAFPLVFVRYDGTKPIESTKLTDGSYGKSKIILSLFAGDKDTTQPKTLSLIEKLEYIFNGNILKVTINGISYSFPMNLTPAGTDFVSYVKGVSVYRVQVEIEVPTGIMPESDIELPAAPVLTTPANNANNVDAEHAALSFTSEPGDEVLDYDIYVSDAADFSNIIFQQLQHIYNTVTIPDGIIEPENTYYWKVKCRNAAGYSEYSGTRAFTTIEAVNVIPLNPSQISNNTLWCRTDNVTTATGNKVTQFTDVSGNGNHLVQATDANRPVLTPNVLGSHPAIFHDPTGNVRKSIAYNDTTKKFEILSGNEKSFMFTIIPDEAYSIGNNTIGLISRGNSNYGTNYIFGKYNDNLNNIRGVLQFPRYNNNSVAALPLVYSLMQVLFVYNGTVMRVYKDGVKVSEFTYALTTPITNEAATWFTIGAEFHNANNGLYYKGYVFETAFWNKALTAGDIASLYEYHKEYYGV